MRLRGHYKKTTERPSNRARAEISLGKAQLHNFGPWVQRLVWGVALPAIAFGQAEIPVLVKPPTTAKVMMIVDDSGSMNAVIEHANFNMNDSAVASCVNDSTHTLPSVIFRLQSGAAAPALTQQLTPVLIENNYGFNASVTGNMYGSQTFSTPTNFPVIQTMTCNNTAATPTCCPGTSGSSCPKTGINTGSLYSNSSITGAAVFAIANLAQSGGSYITDSSGNEYLYLKYRKNDYTTMTEDWGDVWASFNSSGVPQVVHTTTFSTAGGTVVFNGKEVFLSQGWYRGEYLKWIFYCASSSELAALPGTNRILAVRDVMTTLINSNPSVNFGIASLNGSTYSAGTHSSSNLMSQWYTPMGDGNTCSTPRLKAAVGTAAATLLTTVNTLTARGGTPLSTTYLEMLRYFAGVSRTDSCTSSTSAYTSPISGQCDAHDIILLTDGLPTGEAVKKLPTNAYVTKLDGYSNTVANNSLCGSSNDCIASFMSDAAWWGYHTDLRSSVPGTQNVVSYAVGFGVPTYPLLDQFASSGGSGASYNAQNSTDLGTTLQNIVDIIFDTPTSGAGVATLEKLYGETKVYQPIFFADTWTGKIQVYTYNESTQELDYTYDMSQQLEERDLSASPRNIIAGYDPDGDGKTNQTKAFTYANAATLRPELFKFIISGSVSSSLLASPISAYTTSAAAQTLIDYIQGTDFPGMRTRDRDADGYVDRLGDIVYSRPTEVGPKNGNFNALQGYADFTASLQSEPRLLLAGANDGMMHAFNSETGEELWAYIPSSQVPYLERLARPAYNTQYRRSYVDGLMTVEDVYRGGSWRTLLMFGLRTGGSTYTVLDITDRENPTLIWEVSDSAVYGQSWTRPAVVLANGSGSDNPASYSWYMVVGTGEGKTTAGTNLAAYSLAATTPPSATTIAISATDAAGTRTSAVATSQNDADRDVDRLYVGTELGDLYRVKVTGSTPTSWTVARLYDGSTTQPIVAAPLAVLAENPQYTGGGSGASALPLAVGVYFGTGRHDTTTDITTIANQTQGIFGLFDPVDTSNDTLSAVLTNQVKANLQNQSIGTFNIRFDTAKGKYYVPTGKTGFYIDLATSITVTSDNFINPVGEVVYPPINVLGTLLFTTFLPDSAQCDIGGHGFLEGVHFQTGGGSVVDFSIDPDSPFYNGGIPDIDGNGSKSSSDLTSGFASAKLEGVLDAAVESIDLSDEITPYEHDGELTTEDVRLHTSNGGILPAVSAVGHTGLPSSPTVLLGSDKIVIQDAYPSDPAAGGSGSGSGGSSEGDLGDTDLMPPPKLAPMNIYNAPVEVLSFHEVNSD